MFGKGKRSGIAVPLTIRSTKGQKKIVGGDKIVSLSQIKNEIK